MYQRLSSLNLPEYKIKELEAIGYHYCKDVLVSDEKFQSKLTASEWEDLTDTPKTKTALDIYQEESVFGTILTGNKQLNDALGSGIGIGLITEFCGEPGSGKTQICFYLCVNVQLPTWCGGLNGQSIYVSTNKGFASHRLKEIATICVNQYDIFKSKQPVTPLDNNTFNVDSILNNIYCVEVEDLIELIAFVKYAENLLEKGPSIRLLVIDNISTPFKPVKFEERTHFIYRILRDLQKLALTHRFAIVLTNDITTRIDSTHSAYNTPSLGGSYYHRINVRVELSKTPDNLFKATFLKNMFGAQKTVAFNLFS